MQTGYGLAALTFAHFALALAVLPLATAMEPGEAQPAESSEPQPAELSEHDEEIQDQEEDPHLPSELVGSPEILSPNSSAAELAAWAAWLVNSCHVPEHSLSSLALANFRQPSGMVIRGLTANRSLGWEENVVCIPETCWLHGDTKHGEEHESEECTEMEQMAINLAEELAKGAQSQYASWFKLLPDQASLRDHHPAFLKDHAHGPVFDFWKNVSAKVTRCAKDHASQPDAMELSPENLLLASVLAYTRGFRHWGFVPVLDMVNVGKYHNVEFILKQYNKTLNLCISALRPIARHEELYVTYHAMFEYAGSFFTKYGFALDEDDHTPNGHEWDGCKNESHKLPEGHTHKAFSWFDRFENMRQQHCAQEVEEPEHTPPIEEEEEDVIAPFADRMTPELEAALKSLQQAEKETPLDHDDWDEHGDDEEL